MSMENPSSETMGYLQKFAISLGVDELNTEEVVNEAFLYIDCFEIYTTFHSCGD